MTVGRDIPQGTGVESAIQQVSSQKSLDRASIRMARLTRPSTAQFTGVGTPCLTCGANAYEPR